jgi:hypothetical protein
MSPEIEIHFPSATYNLYRGTQYHNLGNHRLGVPDFQNLSLQNGCARIPSSYLSSPFTQTSTATTIEA